MKAPRFSVVMNVYNGAAYLRQAIQTVLAQSCTDWELLLWDDGSSDATPAICRSFDDPRIRTVLAPHVGLCEARNQAIAMARGEWVAFLDQDDLWLPHKLAAQASLIEADSAGRLALVYGRTIRFDAAGHEAPFDPWFGSAPLPQGDIFAELLAKPSFIAFSSAVFRASALRTLGPVPEWVQTCIDYYLTVGIARDHATVCLQTTCCRYRMHDASMTRVFRRAIHEEAIAIVEAAAMPEHTAIVRRRRRVHESWIALEEIRCGDAWAGLIRLLRRGSPSYLALRPVVLLARRLREWVRIAARRQQARIAIRGRSPRPERRRADQIEKQISHGS